MTALLNRDKDTICALATAHGTAGVAVVRVSGAEVLPITRKICPFLPETLKSHRVYYGHLRNPTDDSIVDEVLVSYFKKGKSFSGEDTLEISLHGNPILVDQCLELLILSGARMADRGEFTFRAFMNGRIDLVQAEGVLDLIQSQNRVSQSLSLRQLQGELSLEMQKIKDLTTSTLAHLEANIDFSSEDIEVASQTQMTDQISGISQRMEKLLQTFRAGRILKSGYQVVLVGKPNVGKSSLLNALMGEEKAIVTEIEGTTRDLVEGRLFLQGYQIDITDTAGIRESTDQVELLGQSKTLERLSQADLVLMIVDGSAVLTVEDLKLLELVGQKKALYLLNKSDKKQVVSNEAFRSPPLSLSATKGEGLEDLKREILKQLLEDLPTEDSVVALNSRHFNHLSQAKKMLDESMTLMVKDQSPDLVALELHQALREIYAILGETYDDQVMDRVFNQFCIGK